MNIKWLVKVGICAVMLGASVPAQAQGFKNSDFLAFSSAQRDWFYTGSYMSMGHLITQKDKVQGQCYTDWYARQPKQRVVQIENMLRKYPDHSPTSILIGLAQVDCGKVLME